MHSSFHSFSGYPQKIEEGEQFITSILRDFKPIADIEGMKNDRPNTSGMSVLENVVELETGERGNVVSRTITEKFWQKVIKATETHRVCALGTPGIGKTTTTCILIRLLLKQKKTVVYRVREINEKGFVYMFTPASDASSGVDVNAIREYEFYYDDEHVNNESVYYVVDPGATVDDCNLHTKFRGKVIIVASPDNRHWGESNFQKRRRGTVGTFLYYPMWKFTELLHAGKYFDFKLEDEEIIRRYEIVGGIPRNIFTDDDSFNDILKKTGSCNKRLK